MQAYRLLAVSWGRGGGRHKCLGNIKNDNYYLFMNSGPAWFHKRGSSLEEPLSPALSLRPPEGPLCPQPVTD